MDQILIIERDDTVREQLLMFMNRGTGCRGVRTCLDAARLLDAGWRPDTIMVQTFSKPGQEVCSPDGTLRELAFLQEWIPGLPLTEPTDQFDRRDLAFFKLAHESGIVVCEFTTDRRQYVRNK